MNQAALDGSHPHGGFEPPAAHQKPAAVIGVGNNNNSYNHGVVGNNHQASELQFKQSWSYRVHESPVHSVAITGPNSSRNSKSTNNVIAATASWDGTVRSFSVIDGQEMAVL